MKRALILLMVLVITIFVIAACDGSNGDDNTRPVADAGADQEVLTGDLVILDGSGSSDAEASTLTYVWSFVSIPGGSAAAFSDSTAMDPTFTPDEAGIYVASLVVNDGSRNSTADTIAVYASAELLTNGGFETGDLTAWTYDELPGSAGLMPVISATVTPIGGYTVDSPTEGTYHVVSDQDGPTTDGILQEFTLPGGHSVVSLTFDMFVMDLSGDGPIDAGNLDHTGESNQHARVDILSATAGTFDVGAGVVRNLYKDVDGYDPVLSYIAYSFDLSGDLTAGETYVIRFAQTDNLGPVNMGIDNVSIRSR
jgi:hypothetical protein